MNGSTMTASDWVPGKVGKEILMGADDTVSYTDGTSSPFDVTSAYTLSVFVWFTQGRLSFPFDGKYCHKPEMGSI